MNTTNKTIKLHRVGDYRRLFLSLLQDVSNLEGHRLYRCFSDWLEICAICMHQLPYIKSEFTKDSLYKQYEQQYLDRIRSYTPASLNLFGEMVGLVTLVAHNHTYHDFLGEIFMLQEWGDTKLGQCFTPTEVCRLMSRLALGETETAKQEIEAHLSAEGGVITMQEPACGSGNIILSFAEQLEYMGFDPRCMLQVHAVDIGRDCFNMTYIQLCTHNLQAIVYHGDTLRMDFWETRPTAQIVRYEVWKRDRTPDVEDEEVVAMRQLLKQIDAVMSPPLPIVQTAEEAIAASSNQEKAQPTQLYFF
jgi:hypothetical protein